jgi:hypothetical protein
VARSPRELSWAVFCFSASAVELKSMPAILIRCPVTREPIPTELDTETIILETLPPGVITPILCSACGQTHHWKRADAWVKGDKPKKPS